MIRIREAADLLGVSDDTVCRWIDNGTLDATKDDAGRKVIDGKVLAEFARGNAAPAATDMLGVGSSARNRFVGLVTKVVVDVNDRIRAGEALALIEQWTRAGEAKSVALIGNALDPSRPVPVPCTAVPLYSFG